MQLTCLIHLTCLYPCILTSSCPQVPMHLLESSHPRILISLRSCVLACIFTSLHPHFLRFKRPCLYPCILISSSSCVLACIPAPLHPHTFRFTSVSLSSHPCILISSCLCVVACILASSHPHILQFMCAWYPRILASFYSQVFVRLLVCSHPQVFSTRVNVCIFASSFVSNLQVLRTEQAFLLNFYRASRKIYRELI